MKDDIVVNVQTVPVTSVREHPANPRKGDVDLLVDSLHRHGQYRPIVVQKSTGYILAGSHTWKAAKRLGWKNIGVTFVDIDDENAAKIMITDNRTSDLAAYDDSALLELLTSLDDLHGTGFDELDIDRLNGLFDEDEQEKPATVGNGGGKPQYAVEIGALKIDVSAQGMDLWESKQRIESPKNTIGHVRQKLDMVPPARELNPEVSIVSEMLAEVVPLSDLKLYPLNARQGDVGAIAQSLKKFGQYRPIVANRRTMHILVGNHTASAAKQLGWSKIAVSWVDVDEQDEAKIVLVDNRATDVAAYDEDGLATLLTSLGSLDGTGFDGDDLDLLLSDVENGFRNKKPAATSKIRCKAGMWVWKITRTEFLEWEAKHGSIESEEAVQFIGNALGLPYSDWRVVSE
jgi:ParB-like chromosome segregation protein Spo0J